MERKNQARIARQFLEIERQMQAKAAGNNDMEGKLRFIARENAAKDLLRLLEIEPERPELDDHPPFADQAPNSAYCFWACIKAEEAGLILASLEISAADIIHLNMMRPKPSFSAIELLQVGNHMGASNFFLRRDGQATTRRF